MDSKTNALHRGTDPFVTQFIRLDETRFVGYVFWRGAPHFQFVVEFLLDGEPIGLARADKYCRPLKDLGEKAHDHGFVFIAQKYQLIGHRYLEARIVNLAVPVGQPIDLALQSLSTTEIHSFGVVEWLGGLRIAGSIFQDSTVPRTAASRVKVSERGIVIAEGITRRWTPHMTTRNNIGTAQFDLHLPPQFADGRAHILNVTDENDHKLDGSPLFIQAFHDSLHNLVKNDLLLGNEDTRAAWFDRFLPMSIPFENYNEWKNRFPQTVATVEKQPPVRVVLIGKRHSAQSLDRIAKQDYENWSATTVNSEDNTTFEWSSLWKAVTTDAPNNSIIVFAKMETNFRENAITTLVQALNENESALAAYCDIEITTHAGKSRPLFFGAFDYERMLEQAYAGDFFAIKMKAIKIPAKEKTGNLTRLLLSLCDHQGAIGGEKIIHVPGVLAEIPQSNAGASPVELKFSTSSHLRTIGIQANVSAIKTSILSSARIQRQHSYSGLVSIVVPTRDRIDLLTPCIESIISKTKKYKYEIIIVDNGSATSEAKKYFNTIRRQGIRIIEAPGPFNYSYLNNIGVKAAEGDFVCLLNNDTEILDFDWLNELLSRILDNTVGAVSPTLLWPNRMVQHGGIVLGPNFAASDAFNDCMENDPGYADMLLVAHEVSAVSAACMLVRRKDYQTVGGFDEIAFPVLFNDVDFCLRLKSRGKRNIFTPHTSLLHHESATRKADISYSQKSRFKRELHNLRSRWGHVIANDPLYSPFLNLDPYPFSALAWPPRPHSPRFNTVAKPFSEQQ